MNNNTKDLENLGVNVWNTLASAVTIIGPIVITGSSIVSMAMANSNDVSNKNATQKPAQSAIEQMEVNKVDTLNDDKTFYVEPAKKTAVPAVK